jgi:hypothetical protein
MEIIKMLHKNPLRSEFPVWFAFILSLFLLLIAAPLQAEATHENALDDFFSLLSEGKAAEAMNGLIATNPSWHEAGDGLGDTISQLEQMPTMFGSFIGHERIGKFEYGERIHVLTYLVYHVESAVRMVFVFYQSDETWRIMNFNFSEVTAEELMEAASAAFRD